MKKNKLWIILIVIVALAISAKLLFFPRETSNTKPTGGGGARGPATVSGVIVRGTGLNEIIYASGSVLANEEAMLRPETSGRITMMAIKEGSQVTKGQLLVKINDSDLQAQLRKLTGQMKLIGEKTDRQKTLLEMNGISREAYDEALNQLASLQADIDFTRSQIEKTEIRAPFSGQIGLRYVSEGTTVSPTDNIAVIRQMNPVKIDFSVPEKYSGEISAGDSIRFTIDGSRDVFYGKIYAAEPGIESNTRTYRLRALSDNKDGRLLPGTFARIDILLKKNTGALMIPTQAIIPVLKGKKVFVADNGIAVSRPVETGVRQEKLIEITSGINEGDTIITTGIMQLRDSVPVKVIAK